ncbi:LrgB family protein [Geobacter sp. SVR]|uniref:LrgB family protein n=1 Tax=Geobacter sp. SVR TaxID=2495594 RepID=UPI00143EFBA7|nr:LrgB family protein [Geobacter sp. SVR]BCS52587.1 murein hydrolase effector protein LrgB [Geobacter sp. SVR]GCF83975.1 murein hydrolase effector protein LrgB [Geobacter sp. SVR]
MSQSSDWLFRALWWSVLTIALYMFGKALYRRWPSWWSSPLLVAPLLLIMAALASHVTYREYSRGTHWLVALLAPATVSFAVPIYEQRMLIRRHWLPLLVGVLVGSITAIVSSWLLARLFGLSDLVRLSLLPRSLSTPFAMTVSGDLGGAPALTAVFVVITGVLGAAMGEGLLNCLPLRSVLAQGALFGMGAHGAGTAKAHQIDGEIGAIAGLVMVLVGMLNVLAAPLLAHILH